MPSAGTGGCGYPVKIINLYSPAVPFPLAGRALNDYEW